MYSDCVVKSLNGFARKRYLYESPVQYSQLRSSFSRSSPSKTRNMETTYPVDELLSPFLVDPSEEGRAIVATCGEKGINFSFIVERKETNQL